MQNYIDISWYALKRYCLRMYNDECYHISHPDVKGELIQRLKVARKSFFDPKEFFNGKCIKKQVKLLEDDLLIYAIRDNTLITVINMPGSDKVSDFIRTNRKEY